MATQTPAPAKPASKTDVIPSTAVQKFYSPDGQLVSEGQPYNYTPEPDKPYPWPLLRPQDAKLSEDLEDEYLEAQEKKMKRIESRTSIRSAFEHLSRMQDD